MLKVTKAKVWASMVVGRSFFAHARGMRTVERRICGMKATDSAAIPVCGPENDDDDGAAEPAETRYRRML